MDAKTQTVQYRRAGGVEYELARRRVKNLNLHVRADGSVAVSVPLQTSLREADEFVAAHSVWIGQARERQRRRQERQALLPLPEPAAAQAHFTALSDQVYPAFCRLLGEKPEIRVRDMTSRWGVCDVAKKRITLASRLALQPAAAVEYVIVHEYCHFVHPNHQKEFWALVERFLPDWKARRALLRQG